MAALHCEGKFSDGDPDAEAAIFHLHQAAVAGIAGAQWALAHLYTGYGHAPSPFPSPWPSPSPQNSPQDPPQHPPIHDRRMEHEMLPVTPEKPINPDTAPPSFPVEENGEKAVRCLEAVARQIREPMLQVCMCSTASH